MLMYFTRLPEGGSCFSSVCNVLGRLYIAVRYCVYKLPSSRLYTVYINDWTFSMANNVAMIRLAKTEKMKWLDLCSLIATIRVPNETN